MRTDEDVVIRQIPLQGVDDQHNELAIVVQEQARRQISHLNGQYGASLSHRAPTVDSLATNIAAW